ncbi:DNA replication/repair protein RecF [Tetragenococcus koreensis]|uniref:DNA replication and repair protein RecF n=1 Tax=Tetragenococcus koreensis TaxID=290335 RepID=A0AAN4UC77_9ENTE|nr:DNA replication/repair protein RecF [Tetragenococcus koreensis]MCF1586059.1 DNA replication/repair protein RecF [Tetragenococcus koreensis]MCF1614861.1 DNA replication/repair protein RecF [Tetragenococcus koreensis]MCF1619360.1 DNA replication/repair protein RecF [Tetragenococcus koreensis]MCF1624669.1 DNA replication/repair protein RecF [Tetragenococcus koreensis]MCF1626931.1 DNA replication/repair protein RecF [Tetragenococcus koreensis]
MRLNNLHIRNFRNYDELSLDFHKNVVIFMGENAQGKTNLLESIYALALTRSHRTNNEQELIQWEKEQAFIKGNVQKEYTKVPLELFLTKKGRKTKVNHMEQKKLSSYIGQLNVILFAPEDLSLVKGSPQGRRKFLDMEIGQIDPVYLYESAQYQKILKQRNQYLKQLAEHKQTDELYLDILSEQLIDHGSKVLFARQQFVKQLEYWANQLHQKISQSKEHLTIIYRSSIPGDHWADEQTVKETYAQEIEQVKGKERLRQVTLAGPHRDDMSFLVNEKDVQTFGSQGQQRTTALSVKLAEIDLIKEETGEYPVLLLDDVMSELDDSRQLHLLETIEGKIQTFLTTTTLKQVKDKMSVEPEIFYIRQGQLEGEDV